MISVAGGHPGVGLLFSSCVIMRRKQEGSLGPPNSAALHFDSWSWELTARPVLTGAARTELRMGTAEDSESGGHSGA